MQDLNLSKEEIALIKEKRANDLELKKVQAIQSAEKTIAEYKESDAKELEAYQKYANELNLASMSKSKGDFELVVEEIDCEEVPYFYKEGLEKVELKGIKYTRTSCKIKYIGETVKHQYCYIDEDGDTMRYYGDNPEKVNAFRSEAKYSISVSEHTSGYSYSKKNYGFKMEINGLKKAPHENRNNGKNITNAKTVVKKIQEDIEYRARLVEQEEYNNSLEARVISMVELAFPNAEVSIYDRKVTARFENGSDIVMRYYDKDEEGIELVTTKVSAPSKSNPIEIGKLLEKM